MQIDDTAEMNSLTGKNAFISSPAGSFLSDGIIVCSLVAIFGSAGVWFCVGDFLDCGARDCWVLGGTDAVGTDLRTGAVPGGCEAGGGWWCVTCVAGGALLEAGAGGALLETGAGAGGWSSGGAGNGSSSLVGEWAER